jgi:hypothetical protein
MCGGLFNSVYTDVNVGLEVIYAYQISEGVHRTLQSLGPPGQEVPQIDFTGEMDDAEKTLINCIITHRNGIFSTELNKLKVANKTVKFDDKDLPPNILGQETLSGNTHSLDIDREEIRNKSDGLYTNDTPVEESKLYPKRYLELVVHEFCHAFGEEHGAFDRVNSVSYQRSDNGRCVEQIFSEVLGELPPSHNAFNLKPQSLSWNLGCISTAITNHADYFKSVDSAASAVKTYPTFDVDYLPYAK